MRGDGGARPENACWRRSRKAGFRDLDAGRRGELIARRWNRRQRRSRVGEYAGLCEARGERMGFLPKQC